MMSNGTKFLWGITISVEIASQPVTNVNDGIWCASNVCGVSASAATLRLGIYFYVKSLSKTCRILSMAATTIRFWWRLDAEEDIFFIVDVGWCWEYVSLGISICVISNHRSTVSAHILYLGRLWHRMRASRVCKWFLPNGKLTTCAGVVYWI